MPRGSYSDKEKEQVYAMYAAGISGREIARQLDIPEPTIRFWVKQERDAYNAQNAQKKVAARSYAEKVPKGKEPKPNEFKPAVDLDGMRTAKRIEFIQSAWELIGKGVRLADKRLTRALEQEGELDEIIGVIESNDMNDKEKSALISKVRTLQIQNVRELSTLIGTMYDKAALASGDPTQKVDGNAGVVLTFDNLPDGTTLDEITG